MPDFNYNYNLKYPFIALSIHCDVKLSGVLHLMVKEGFKIHFKM